MEYMLACTKRWPSVRRLQRATAIWVNAANSFYSLRPISRNFVPISSCKWLATRCPAFLMAV